VISTLVDWNNPPAFPAGIPTSAPGRLATPSSEEGNVEGPTVQALDIEIDSFESVKESLPHPHAEDLDRALVEDNPEPALVEPQLTSQTFVVDPSFHPFSNDLVNDTRIADDEGIIAAPGREIDVELTLEDATQLVDKDSANESAPTQQYSEDIDDKIESKDVDISMKETKIQTGESLGGLGLFPVFILRRKRSSRIGLESRRCSSRRAR
jgi:hypothetical protein